jgi:mono/diheme cytochrome c family protein
MIRKFALAVIGLAILGGFAFWLLTMPKRLDAATLARLGAGDAARGERIFWAGGCSSCHARPKATGKARFELGGGVELKTPFGVFVAPNISPDRKDGIGAWTVADFANALLRGVAPDGSHLYPAFPYTSYTRMKLSDVADLYAFLKTLPPVSGKAPPHRIPFPFSIRRGLGLWKLVYLTDRPMVALPANASPAAREGQYLVEGPGHCGECHTTRSIAGAMKPGEWLAGAYGLPGNGNAPNITPGEGGIGDWSEKDIAYFLETGFTPDFDSVGGAMVEVQRNMAELPAADREAIAAYLKAVPPLPTAYAKKK